MYVVDTGPVLKFFATNNERWLFGALGHNPIHAPDAVREEVFSVPTRRKQFERAPRVWQRVENRFVIRLSDEPTPELAEAARNVLAQNLEQVQSVSQDLGEKMALLHASLGAERGERVVVLCDDQAAQHLIAREGARLQRRGASGSVSVVDTIRVLTWAVEAGVIDDKNALRAGYARMAALDESLPRDIATTGLLRRPHWPSLGT